MSTTQRLYVCDQPHQLWYEHIYSSYQPFSPHNSKHLFDIYSLTHTFWSLFLLLIFKTIFGQTRIIPFMIFFITTLFEFHENLSSQITKYQRIEVGSNGISSYRGDSLINVIGDILSNVLGLYIGYYYSDTVIIIVLSIIFMIITGILGLTYWTDFLNFLS